jgi:hypothetical protein
MLELVDQSGAFLDQSDLVAAKLAQLGHQRIKCLQRTPFLTLQAQCVRQAPGVKPVGLRTAWPFAFAVAARTFGIDRIDLQAAREQLFDRRSFGGLDCHSHGFKAAKLFRKQLPACAIVRDAEVADDSTLPIDDDHIVMIFRPVQRGEVCELFP